MTHRLVSDVPNAKHKACVAFLPLVGLLLSVHPGKYCIACGEAHASTALRDFVSRLGFRLVFRFSLGFRLNWSFLRYAVNLYFFRVHIYERGVLAPPQAMQGT